MRVYKYGIATFEQKNKKVMITSIWLSSIIEPKYTGSVTGAILYLVLDK
jgi:hypothetical protein